MPDLLIAACIFPASLAGTRTATRIPLALPFGSLGLGWSRKLANHRAAVALFVVAHNFCKRHSSIGTSPAVRSNLTDHVWIPVELIQHLSETN